MSNRYPFETLNSLHSMSSLLATQSLLLKGVVGPTFANAATLNPVAESLKAVALANSPALQSLQTSSKMIRDLQKQFEMPAFKSLSTSVTTMAARVNPVVEPWKTVGLASGSIFQSLQSSTKMMRGIRDGLEPPAFKTLAASVASMAAASLVMDSLRINNPLFSQYWRRNPPTKAEWDQAGRELNNYDLDGSSLLEQEALTVAIEAPENNRLFFLTQVLIALILLLVTIELSLQSAYKKEPYAARAFITATILASTLFGMRFQKVIENWPVVKGIWKNTLKPAPIAKVVSQSSRMIPVYERSSGGYEAICWLSPGDFVVLNSAGTKRMKAVVVEVDEQGNPIKIGWVKRRNLKQVSLKQSYVIKRIAEQK